MCSHYWCRVLASSSLRLHLIALVVPLVKFRGMLSNTRVLEHSIFLFFFSNSGGLRNGSREAGRPSGGDGGRAAVKAPTTYEGVVPDRGGASMAIAAVGGGGEDGGRLGR